MVEYGARFLRSDDGGFQIDQDYRNYELVAEGAAQLARGRNRIAIPAVAASPLIALRATSVAVAWNGLEENSFGRTVAFNLFADSGVTVDYRVFAPGQGATSGYGLHVFAPNEAPVFDSNKQYMVMLGNNQNGADYDSEWYLPASVGGYKLEMWSTKYEDDKIVTDLGFVKIVTARKTCHFKGLAEYVRGVQKDGNGISSRWLEYARPVEYGECKWHEGWRTPPNSEFVAPFLSQALRDSEFTIAHDAVTIVDVTH